MFLAIQPDDPRPIYQQIADGIKALIANGSLVEGQALPPVRQVAGDLGINLNTVAIAYRQLQDEGFITIRHGSGASIAARRPSKTNREELREEAKVPLRTALTRLVLAGLAPAEILELVRKELKGITTP